MNLIALEPNVLRRIRLGFLFLFQLDVWAAGGADLIVQSVAKLGIFAEMKQLLLEFLRQAVQQNRKPTLLEKKKKKRLVKAECEICFETFFLATLLFFLPFS